MAGADRALVLSLAATIGQIRLRLFKIAVRIKVSVRRIPTLPNPERTRVSNGK